MDGSNFIVISGPSGVGKNTIIDGLMRKFPEITYASTLTTRMERPNDVPGKYVYVTPAQFEQRADELLECNRYGEHWYGSLIPPPDAGLVLFEVDINGALQIRKKFPWTNIFGILPHGSTDDEQLAVLRRRLEARGTDSPAAIERRLEIAKDEMPLIRANARFLIINRHSQRAIHQMVSGALSVQRVARARLQAQT